MLEQRRATAWHVWINGTAWQGNGIGVAWARRAMCESALRPHVTRTDLHKPCTSRFQWEGFLWEFCYCVVATAFLSSDPWRMPPHVSILRCKQQRICISLGVYSSTGKWRKKIMYDSLLWETEQKKEFLHFMETESLLTCSKQPHLETHKNTTIPRLLILFNRSPLQYYTPIL